MPSTEDYDRTTRILPQKQKRRKWNGISQGVYMLVDLIDFHGYANENNGYKYIMVCEDLYSRYVQAEPMKTKTLNEMKKTFRKIFQKGRMGIPNFISCDEESAVVSETTQDWLADEFGVSVYNPQGKFGVAPVERFIRTFKEDLAPYFIDSKNWIDHYQNIIDNYNNNKHSALNKVTREKSGKKGSPLRREKLTPSTVWNKEDSYKEKINPPKMSDKDTHPQFHKGDNVRIAINKNLQRNQKKTLIPNYSKDIFRVRDIDTTRKPIGYRLTKITNHALPEGQQYAQARQEINNADKRLFYHFELKKARL